MKHLILTLALVGWLFTLAAQENPNAPRFEFTEETHDFGEVPEGPNAVTKFFFKNVGKEPLIITKARAGCSCTVPDWPKEPILPGQEASITVSYTTKGRKGAINKTITISSNADTPNKHLKIKGRVVPATPSITGDPVKKKGLPHSQGE